MIPSAAVSTIARVWSLTPAIVGWLRKGFAIFAPKETQPLFEHSFREPVSVEANLVRTRLRCSWVGYSEWCHNKLCFRTVTFSNVCPTEARPISEVIE